MVGLCLHLLANVHANDLSDLGITLGRIHYILPLLLIIQLVAGKFDARKFNGTQMRVKRVDRSVLRARARIDIKILRLARPDGIGSRPPDR